MNGAADKDQKFKSRTLFLIEGILLFLVVLLVLPAAVPLEFHVGRHLIRMESGIAESAPFVSFKKPFEAFHAIWFPTRNPPEKACQFRLGRCYFRLAVQTRNIAAPDTSTAGKP